MVSAHPIESMGRRPVRPLESEAQELARALPRLALEARQVSAQVALGIHGRRRAGPGETFWQFRPFTSGEPAHRIDWRRSARDDRLYVREREWETASTYWVWADCSASMAYVSSLAKAAKRDRAVVMAFAMADLLVRGGERVGLLGLTNPLVSRVIIERFSEALLRGEASNASEMPVGPTPGPRDRVILFGDFIMQPEDFRRRLEVLTLRGAPGIAVQIRDPAETLFPFDGEMEFFGPELDGRWVVGDAAAMADRYRQRLAAHEAQLREICLRRGWIFQTHSSGQTANEGLLALAMLLEHGAATMRGGG
jgi:uncharacterized protein (DUF58 family)